MRFAIIIFCIAFLLYWLTGGFRRENFDVLSDEFPVETDVSFAPLVTEPPYQEKTKSEPFKYKDVVLEPLYDFIVTARVLSKKNYSDEAKAYVPTDLALGWGKMSKENILKDFDISQRNRWFYWRTDKMTIPTQEVISSAANMHIIPASELVQDLIDSVSEGDVIQISGKLVNLSRDDGFRKNTSTTRKDSGGGACEIIFVESAELVY